MSGILDTWTPNEREMSMKRTFFASMQSTVWRTVMLRLLNLHTCSLIHLFFWDFIEFEVG